MASGRNNFNLNGRHAMYDLDLAVFRWLMAVPVPDMNLYIRVQNMEDGQREVQNMEDGQGEAGLYDGIFVPPAPDSDVVDANQGGR